MANGLHGHCSYLWPNISSIWLSLKKFLVQILGRATVSSSDNVIYLFCSSSHIQTYHKWFSFNPIFLAIHDQPLLPAANTVFSWNLQINEHWTRSKWERDGLVCLRRIVAEPPSVPPLSLFKCGLCLMEHHSCSNIPSLMK